jgi:hypothetical protein
MDSRQSAEQNVQPTCVGPDRAIGQGRDCSAILGADRGLKMDHGERADLALPPQSRSERKVSDVRNASDHFAVPIT